MIEVKHLSKSFGDLQAVDDISFSVKKGQLFAFLGVNGAGKSTTLHMIGRLLGMDEGEIEIAGMDVVKSHSEDLAKIMTILR